jgi:hypothetical protein
LGLSIVAAGVWYALYRPARMDPEAAAARGLDTARKAADRIEGDMQKRADDLLQQPQEQQ